MNSYIEKARSIEQTLKFYSFNGEQAQVSMPAVQEKLGGKVVCSISLDFPTTPSVEKLEQFRKQAQAFLAHHNLTLGETYLITICMPSSVLVKYQLTVDLN